MSKGRKPRINNPYTVTVRDATGEGGSGYEETPENCWTFFLIDITEVATKVKAGDVVTGNIISTHNEVIISAAGKPLGKIPSDFSVVVAKIAKDIGGTLRGMITLKPSDDEIEVHICLL